MKCPSCHFENRERAGFCGSCGVKLFRLCTHCATESPAENVFCDRCGSDLGKSRAGGAIDFNRPRTYTPNALADKILTTRSRIEGERKLVTVLFADAADYTSMSEKLDPEEVHELLGGFFDILVDRIHGCEGTIDKFTGDGVMALFGAPLAHEDHAHRACHAALAIQKAIGEYGERIKETRGVDFKVRIGLNSGTVIVGSVGDDLKMDYTAIGDTTNLASRMEANARPGAVLVSGHTYNLARDFFEFIYMGKISVKGKKAPQRAYELIRDKGFESRMEAAAARGLTRFVGRREEMEALRSAFEKARSGSGQVVEIVGDAGVGKSRLLREFRNEIEAGDHNLLEGRCLHYGATVVYLPILGIVRSCFDIKEGDPEEEVQKKLREGLRRIDEELLGGLPPLQDLLSLRIQDEAYLQIEPPQRREKIFRAVRDVLLRASRKTPLTLAVEDLHWIDTTSQEFLGFLVEALSDASILLVLVYRPEYTRGWGAPRSHTRIGLEELTTRTSAEFVEALLAKGKVAPELQDLILKRAGGNPLFLEEVTNNLLESGSILRDKDRYVLTRSPSEIDLPDTVHGIIAARMDRLEEELKRIVQVAAVVGREFAYRILKTITTGMTTELKPLLARLQSAELIYEKRLSPESAYTFKHAITQEVAYASLLRKRRRQLHEQIGRAIEGLYAERIEEHYELLAYHFVQSNNTAKAVEYLDLANQKTAQANAMEDAKGHFDKAMELLHTLPDLEENRERRISLLVNQDKVFFGLLRIREYYGLLTRYEPVAATLKNPGLQGQLYAVMGYCELTFSHLDQAVETCTRAVKLCQAAGDMESAGYAIYISAFAHLFKADFDRTLGLAKEALRITAGMPNPRIPLRASWVACVALARQGRFDEAVEFGKKALAAEGEISTSWGWGGGALSYAYTLKRDLSRAIEQGESAVAKAQTMVTKTMAQHILGLALCHGGRTSEGIPLLEGVRGLFRATGTVMMEVPATQYLAQGYWLAGEYDKGRQAAADLLKIVEPCGARYDMGYGYFLLGEMAGDADPGRAGACFEKSIAVFHEIRAENELAMACAGYGRLHKQQGNSGKARAYLCKALELFERLGTLMEPDKVRRELADLSGQGGRNHLAYAKGPR